MFKKNAKTKVKNLNRKIEYDFLIQEPNFATIIEKTKLAFLGFWQGPIPCKASVKKFVWLNSGIPR